MSTFFSELHAMALAVGPVGVIVTASGETLSIHVKPCPNDDAASKTLCEEFFLAGTPSEFDAEFIPALANYRTEVVTFSEQIASNVARVEQAGRAAVANAAKPAAKTPARAALPKPATPPALPAPAASSEGAPPAAATPQPAKAPSPQQSLFDLAPTE